MLSHCVLWYQHSAPQVPSTSTSSLALSLSFRLSTSFSHLLFPRSCSSLGFLPSLFPSPLFPPFFLPPSPFPSVAVLHSSAQGHPLACISTSLLMLSCFFLGGTMGICQALQLSHFSRPKPPLGPSWCGRASANLGILSCPSSLTSLNLGLMLHQLGQPVPLGPGSKSRTSRSCVR